MIFWERFISLCNERSVKPNAFGREMAVSSSMINQWKNGSFPGAESLLKISKYFGVSIDYLLGVSDIKSTDNATRAQCQALGLSDETIDYLQTGEGNAIAANCFDFLIRQHKNSMNYKKIYNFSGGSSILYSLSALLASENSNDDLQVVLRAEANGHDDYIFKNEIIVEKDGEEKTLLSSADLRLPIPWVNMKISISDALLEKSINDIAATLRLHFIRSANQQTQKDIPDSLEREGADSGND